MLKTLKEFMLELDKEYLHVSSKKLQTKNKRKKRTQMITTSH